MWDDLTLIWGKDQSRYPQGSAAPLNWWGFWLRVKCTICILLGREGRDPYVFSCIPLGIDTMYVGHSWDGPTCDWSEIGVDHRWNCWQFYRYRNGI